MQIQCSLQMTEKLSYEICVSCYVRKKKLIVNPVEHWSHESRGVFLAARSGCMPSDCRNEETFLSPQWESHTFDCLGKIQFKINLFPFALAMTHTMNSPGSCRGSIQTLTRQNPYYYRLPPILIPSGNKRGSFMSPDHFLAAFTTLITFLWRHTVCYACFFF